MSTKKKVALLITVAKTRNKTSEKSARFVAKKETVNTIDSAINYKKTMKRIDVLMAKGSVNVSQNELKEIRKLAVMAQSYEKKKFQIAAPTTLQGIIEMKMFDLQLKQNELAKKLQVSTAKLSLILGGKQKPDAAFLKAAHVKLNIDAHLLLNAI